MPLRVGIDIGGTFTDLAAGDTESGDLIARKVPSTPPDLARGAAAALAALGDSAPLESVTFLAHGTTAGTNALIEGAGARTAPGGPVLRSPPPLDRMARRLTRPGGSRPKPCGVSVNQ